MDGQLVQGSLSQGAQPVRLKLDFVSDAASRGYVAALTSLLHGLAESCVILDSAGRSRDDLGLGEITHRIRTASTLSLQLLVRAESALQKITVELASETVRFGARIPLDAGPNGLAWLQSDLEHVAPVLVLALPTHNGYLAVDALNALVSSLHGLRAEDTWKIAFAADGRCNPTGTANIEVHVFVRQLCSKIAPVAPTLRLYDLVTLILLAQRRHMVSEQHPTMRADRYPNCLMFLLCRRLGFCQYLM